MQSIPYSIEVVTAPASEPLTLAQAKSHLRVDALDTAGDDDIERLIKAAREKVENDAGSIRLINTVLKLRFDRFPTVVLDGETTLYLPVNPIQSIASLSYYSTTGTLTAHTNYISDLYSVYPCIIPTPQTSWPTHQDRPGAVVLQGTFGYGSSRTDVPAKLIYAMQLLIGHWYEHREAVTERQMHEVPQAYTALIQASCSNRI